MFGFRYRDDLHTGQMSGERASVGGLEEGEERRSVCRSVWSSPASSRGRAGAMAPLRWAARDMVAGCCISFGEELYVGVDVVSFVPYLVGLTNRLLRLLPALFVQALYLWLRIPYH